MIHELHSIKKFRGGKLGIIRLNKLAIPRDIVIKLGEEEFVPIGYDTYGHPIISEANFVYYKALKAIKERQGGSLAAEVDYTESAFAIRRDVYDSKEGIEENISTLTELKKLLIYRKQANFVKKELNTFILFGKYALFNDGHVYECSYQVRDTAMKDRVIMALSEVDNFELLEEVHIPCQDDVCAVCGKKFSIEDVMAFAVTEDDDCRKVHKSCKSNCVESVNYQRASQIIDSVYQDVPQSEVVRERIDAQKEKVWYLYHTMQGDVAIRFKKKVIEIKWCGNFKPFNLETLFKDEDVTKRKMSDSKIIHAWSVEDAIKYLMIVKRA